MILIEDASQLDLKELEGAGRVGVTAGASTPEWENGSIKGPRTRTNASADIEWNEKRLP